MTPTRIALSLIALLIPLLANAGDINQDLIEAAKKGDTAAVKASLANGADVNAKDKKGRTALSLAVSKDLTGAVELLKKAGAQEYARAQATVAAEPDARKSVDASSQREVSPSKEADIRRLINAPGGEQQFAGMMQELSKYTGESLKQRLQKYISPGRAEEIMIAFYQKLTPQLFAVIHDVLISIYDKHLTAEEIKTLAEFYESPVGQSFVKVQPRLISESLPVVAARLRPIAGLVFQELVEEFPELGIPSNEVMAVGNLRVTNITCITYMSTYSRGVPAALTEPGPDGADLLFADLAGGRKDCYVFEHVASDNDGDGTLDAYQVSASPIEYRKTGTRSFFTDESGVIRSTKEDRSATAADPPVSPQPPELPG